MTIFRSGDRVRLTCAGRTVEAEVILASDNGRSLMLKFDAIIAGFVRHMPVLWWTTGGWQALNGAAVELEQLTS